MKKNSIPDGIAIIFVLFLVAGCFLMGCSMFRKNEIEIDYPNEIAQMCVGASTYAQTILAKHGMPTERRWSVKVRTYRCTKKVRGMWVWEDKQYGWIGGYHSLGNIMVGCSPTGDEVNLGVLRHEFGHYWKMSNGYGHQYNDHDPFELFGVR